MSEYTVDDLNDDVDDFADTVFAERRRQLMKWGVQRHPDVTDPGYYAHFAKGAAAYKASNGDAAKSWADILLEEVCEALAEIDPHMLRDELIQCAAVIQAWVTDIDTREGSA